MYMAYRSTAARLEWEPEHQLACSRSGCGLQALLVDNRHASREVGTPAGGNGKAGTYQTCNWSRSSLL